MSRKWIYRCFAVCLLLLTNLNVNSQDSFMLKKNTLKLTPLKLIREISPAAEISFERMTGNHFSTQVSAAYILPVSIWQLGDNFPVKNNGFTFALEERFYVEKRELTQKYIGLETEYLQNNYVTTARFGKENPYTDPPYVNYNYRDTFTIQKRTFNINLKYGCRYNYKHISVDMYIGLGIRYRHVAHSGRRVPEDAMERPKHPNVIYANDKEGFYWTVSAPIGIKLGWVF